MKNNNIENKSDVRNLIFLVGYIVLIYHSMFSEVTFLGDVIFGRYTYHAALLLLGYLAVINILKIGKRRFLLFVAATLILSISSYLAKDLFLIVMWITILAAKNIDLRNFIKKDIAIKIIGFVIVLTAFWMGLTNNGIYFRDDIVRQTLGFNNPNTLSNYILSTYIGVMFLMKKKNMLFKTVATLTSAAVIYFIAGSRTQVVGLVLIYILMAVRGRMTRKKIKKLINATPLIFTICAGASYVATIAYINIPNKMEWLNELLSGRLWLAAKAFRSYGIGIVGNVHMTKGMLNYPIDNIYMNIMIIHGVVPLIALSIFIYKFSKYLIRNKKYNDLTILSTFVLLGMSESELFKPYYNPYIIESSKMLLSDSSSKNKETATC